MGASLHEPRGVAFAQTRKPLDHPNRIVLEAMRRLRALNRHENVTETSRAPNLARKPPNTGESRAYTRIVIARWWAKKSEEMSKMKISRKLLLVSVVALFALCSALAYAATWSKIGERHVNDRADHDTVMVTGDRGMFDALKFKVSGHAVHFIKVVVHFRNGGKQELQMRDVIPAGGESRVIDLNANNRVIRKIDFWYEANSIGKAGATVAIWGRR